MTGVLVAALVSAAPTKAQHATDGQSAPVRRPAARDAFVLTLGEQRFDPLRESPKLPVGLDSVRVSGPDLHLVQFMGPIQRGWVESIRNRGLHVIQYIHPYTYVVWGEAKQLDATRTATAVRWTGPFVPAYRLLPRWQNLSSATLRGRALVVRVADADRVVRDIAALGVQLEGRRILDDRFELVGFAVSGSALASIAKIPGVYTVQPVPTDGGLRGEMSDQVCVNNVLEDNQAFPGYSAWLATLGLSGNGVIIANVDSGIQNDHPDLVNRLIACTGQTCGGTTTSTHGTHTAGIMAADGSSGVLDSYGFLRGLGMAPGAHLVEQVYSPWFTQTGGMLLLMQESRSNGAFLSGNSWGPSGTPKGYDSDTMQVDVGVRDVDPNTPGNQPLAYVLSIMNGYGGTSSQGTPDEAKNIFTVGSTKMQQVGGAQILQIDDLSSNTGQGPALDGRKIPHLVAPGCSVDSSFPTSSHALLCGTSMASPHVSGAVALFVEYYRGLFAQDPSAALIKAAFLPVAHDLAGHLDANGNVLGHPFDSKQGWGRLDVAAVLDPPLPVLYFDAPYLFDETGQEWIQIVTASDPNQPMRMMLVWTDAPGHGLGGSTPAWNNDLDLVVEHGTDTYYGNYFGPDGWSAPGGTADGMNNTEGVFIGPASAGSYTIRVVASNINSDGVPGNSTPLDQDFALVCYNCVVEPGFIIQATPRSVDVCSPGDATYHLNISQVLGFTDPVTLSVEGAPAGSTTQFDPNPVIPPGTATLTIGTAGVSEGTYPLHVVGQSGTIQRTWDVSLRVFAAVPDPIVLLSPPDQAQNTSIHPTLTWNADPRAATYEVEVTTDPTFETIDISAADLTDTTFTIGTDLAAMTTYYWRVRAINACGNGSYSGAFQFTTRPVPSVLLVDDDDNNPDVRSYYTDALAALGQDYDVWDTQHSDNEPSASDLTPYSVVIWFTGHSFAGFAGPGAAGSAALADFLTHGKNLLISSQDYYFDRGLTAFMSQYLGVASVAGDVANTVVTGDAPVFGGLGPYTLAYPFTNFSDVINPDATAQAAFAGDKGTAAITKDDPVYRTAYFGFPLEAITPTTNRAATLAAVLGWFRPWQDCNQNGIADYVDIQSGKSQDVNQDGIPDECEHLGDMNCDGYVNNQDIDGFILALFDTAGYVLAYPNCSVLHADYNGDGVVNNQDIDGFLRALFGP